MKKFTFEGDAEILHLNTRKEGAEEAKELAVDVKFRAVAERIYIGFFDELLDGILYTDVGAVRNQMFGPIPMKHEFDEYKLSILGSTHFGIRLKKFSLEPIDGGKVAIVFQASFKPSGSEVAQMAEYLQDGIEIRLEPSSEELDLDGASLAPSFDNLSDDELYSVAIQYVVEQNKASISAIQRQLRIGYNRAARFIEQMEATGIVSPMDNSGHRQVLKGAM